MGRPVTVSIRPLALPAEHGAWGLLLEPLVLALLVAPSAAGFLIGFGSLAAFLARQPLKLAARDWLGRRYPRTAVCELLAAANLVAAVLAFASAWRVAGWTPFMALLPAIPLAVIQFAQDVRMRSRTLVAEVCGAAAPATLAAAIALAGGRAMGIALGLAALVLARSVPAVLFVRSAFSPKPKRAMTVTTHGLAVIGATNLWLIGIAPWTAIVAMLALFTRSLLPTTGLPARTIGFREVGWGASTVPLIALGYRI